MTTSVASSATRPSPSSRRILWVGTKCPWPPSDGGRLVVLESLRALSEAGVEISFVAPVESGRLEASQAALSPLCKPYLIEGIPNGALRSAVLSLRYGLPLGIARHYRPSLQSTVKRLLEEVDFDHIHVEQVQAMTVGRTASHSGVPVVLRAQNVESDLWRAALQRRLRIFARVSSLRLARWEGRAVGRADLTVALTEIDADRLSQLCNHSGRVVCLPPPFPATLEPGERLEGCPSIVLLAGGWWPNAEGAAWFLREGLSELRRRLPGARLHVFGDTVARRRLAEWMGARVEPEAEVPTAIEWHSAPTDSSVAFPEGAILLVPLRAASGIRMKILEGWARGLPVVASPIAAAGLGAVDGRELLQGDSPSALTEAIVRVVEEEGLATDLVSRGRQKLRDRHDPGAWAARFSRLYSSLRNSEPR